MAKKVIKIPLTSSGIDKAIKEIEAYKEDVIKKTELLRQKVADRLAQIAQEGFNSAIVDNLISQEGGSIEQVAAKIEGVTVQNIDSNLTLVIASGEDVIWAEFGAGVYYNGAAGSSPHPKGAELGFTIGSYGKGKGKREVWGYRDEDGLHLTHGAKASMPMYRAMEQVSDEIYEIAKEVFR